MKQGHIRRVISCGALSLLMMGCGAEIRSESDSGALSQEQAALLVWQLPEAQYVRDRVLERGSGGGQLEHRFEGSAPVDVGGDLYWLVNLDEVRRSHQNRWATFAVDLESREVWFVHPVSDRLLTLTTWRSGQGEP